MGFVEIVDLGTFGWIALVSGAALVLLVIAAIAARRSMSGTESDIASIRESLRDARWRGPSRGTEERGEEPDERTP